MQDIGKYNKENREKWLYKTLKEIPDGRKILDAGAGQLQYKKYCEHLDYTSQDFAQYDGTGDGSGLQMGDWDNTRLDITSDITDIPVKAESFDAVMCIEVLEHVPDPAKAIKEIDRVLKKGGVMIITAPFASFTHFAPYHFSNGFNKYYYQYHLEKKLNYKIEDIQTNGSFFDFLAQELNRLPDIADKYSDHDLERADYINKKLEILNILQSLKDKDRGSDEFACYGYHVKAKKHG